MFSIALFTFLVLLAHEVAAQSGIPSHPTLPACVRNDHRLLLPDLIVENPAHARTALRGGRRLLEFETAVGNIGAGALLNFFLEEIGPLVYNQTVAQLQERLQQRMQELDIEFHEDEFQYWRRQAKARR